MSTRPRAEADSSSPEGGDPLFVHARRELVFTMTAWLIFGLWVVGYSWVAGNRPPADPDNLSLVLGMPAWVFWGIGLPWVMANVLTFWYCFRFMVDDDLEVVLEESAEDAVVKPASSRGGCP